MQTIFGEPPKMVSEGGHGDTCGKFWEFTILRGLIREMEWGGVRRGEGACAEARAPR